MAATGGPNSLQTLTDIELQGLEGGAPMEARAAEEMRRRALATGQRGVLEEKARAESSLIWKISSNATPITAGRSGKSAARCTRAAFA